MASKKPPLETAAPASDKKKALETAVAQIERNFGKGSIMRLGENTQTVVDAIPTGSLSLDLALGIGGVPRERIIEIYGPESSGKTTLALHIVAEAQKRGGEVAYIDAEHAMDPYYARALGVDIDSMLISQPDTGEQLPFALKPNQKPALNVLGRLQRFYFLHQSSDSAGSAAASSSGSSLMRPAALAAASDWRVISL